MTLHLDDPVTSLSGVGPALARKLEGAFGIETVRDLLEHYPRRYHDAGEVRDLAEVREGEPATLLGEVVDWQVRRTSQRGRRGPLDLATATVRQASGSVFTATFFNQRWRPKQMPEGTVAAFSGTVKRFRSDLQLASPDVQVLGRVAAGLAPDEAEARLSHQRLLAVYRATDRVPSFKISQLVDQALEQLGELDDWMPDTWRAAHGLAGLDRAVRGIHQPADHDDVDTSRRRLVFDELVTLQLGLQARRAKLESDVVGLDNTPRDGELAARFLQALPFGPTRAQNDAFREIGGDLAGFRPMHRLLQGDVGSGKTMVAVWAMLCAADAGRQAALMVPTEVLADQHHRTLTELLAPIGVNVLDGVRVAALTSSTPTSDRRRILGELLSGEIHLLVGTHALLEEGVRFADLGVVVIDEQHRFGVSQRVGLKEKGSRDAPEGGAMPDVLVMTATPIPRSLALTLYGDLDVTVLDELPPGRQPIATRLITPAQEKRRAAVEDFVREQAAAGGRAYVVCPFVEDSDTLPGVSAVAEHRRLATEVFPDLEVELVHGQLRPAERDRAMERFRSGEAQVLVSTTVVEVGLDVPEATVMIIEDAERFGISQLHQLRGRVGRGDERSYCVLFAGWRGELSDEATQRLEAVARSTDGFELSEVDLGIRGEGQLFGQRQSGMPDLKLTRLIEDRDVVAETREFARQVIASDPELLEEEHGAARVEVVRRYAGGIEAFAALETG